MPVNSESHQDSVTAVLITLMRFLHVKLLQSTCTLGTEAEEVTNASQRFSKNRSCTAGGAVSAAAGVTSAKVVQK